MSLLEVEGLSVRIGDVAVVDDLSFVVERGERIALIGESGSGKSMTALALISLLPDGAVPSGRVFLDGEDLVTMPERRRCELRGERIAMIFQEPMTALNPTMRVGQQVAEILRIHRGAARHEAAARALELLERVEFADPQRVARAFPHELSGGQRQRIMVSIALACNPALVLADEPTTALDVTVQAQMLRLLTRLVAEEGSALVLISHDLAVVSSVCEQIMVMYGGRIVERGPTADVLAEPRHPYTAGLLATSGAMSLSVERGVDLPTIAGSVPSLGAFPAGCVFRNRCSYADAACLATPVLEGGEHAAACFHPLGAESLTRPTGGRA